MNRTKNLGIIICVEGYLRMIDFSSCPDSGKRYFGSDSKRVIESSERRVKNGLFFRGD